MAVALSNWKKRGGSSPQRTRTSRETTAELTALREQLRCRLDSLPENIRNVMQLRYIVGASWQMVAIQCHYSKQHTFRLLNQGELMINSSKSEQTCD